MSDTVIYFAYGSNLWPPRMRDRIPSARFVARCWLPGFELAFHKLGADGSAKAGIRFTGGEEDVVHGVAYRISARERSRLDGIEGGYHRATVTAVRHGAQLSAFTYIAVRPLGDPPAPFEWYRELILEGARWHGLPGDYIDKLAQVDTAPDPDRARCAANRP